MFVHSLRADSSFGGVNHLRQMLLGQHNGYVRLTISLPAARISFLITCFSLASELTSWAAPLVEQK